MTQMERARGGQPTPQMETVALKEGMHIEKLMDKVARGVVAIPANINHHSLDAEGVGEGLRTKINVNLGISRDCLNYEHELEKAHKSIELGAEAIMDLSNYGCTQEFRRKLVETSPAMIGTVPMYDAIGFLEKDLGEITVDEFFEVVEMHARDGVDFMTVHAGINRQTAQRFKKNPRLMNIVSRGGSLLFAWMELTGSENPFYEHYERLMEICHRYDVTISLGDACRPGCIDDATDAAQIEELMTLGELTRAAWDKNVQVIVEGPGHMAIDEITANIKLQKRLCHGAPFYLLGPLVTDIAPGYDHITSAIGGAIAASAGADFLCYVTPAEHLRLPTLDDVKEGIMATRIAAHAADIAKGVPGAREWDRRMANARRKLDWEAQFKEALDPEKARVYRESSAHDGQTCTMCGKMCAIRTINKTLAGEKINLI